MDARGPSRRLFDLWSHIYDNPLVQRLTYRPVQNAVLRAVKQQAPSTVLDVGCGTGLLTMRLVAETGARTIGCDYSRGMLEHASGNASGNASGPSWVQGDAVCLPFAAGSVAAIVCTESFHWYPDQPQALREFARVLCPGGRAYVALVNPPTEIVSRTAADWSRAGRQPIQWPTRSAMRAMMQGAGLRVVVQRRLFRIPAGPLLPPVLTVAERPV